MNKLESIKIENIKGIGNKQFMVNLFPNKPSIFVAPNGFGKSYLKRKNLMKKRCVGISEIL